MRKFNLLVLLDGTDQEASDVFDAVDEEGLQISSVSHTDVQGTLLHDPAKGRTVYPYVTFVEFPLTGLADCVPCTLEQPLAESTSTLDALSPTQTRCTKSAGCWSSAVTTST
jgi:hypothetical protein